MFRGKKTYLVSLAMLMKVAIEWYLTGHLDLTLGLEALGLSALRAGVAKS